MSLSLVAAAAGDAPSIAALRNAVADDLTARHGKGPGSGHCSDKGVLFDLRQARVYVARQSGRIIATLVLGTRKPWSIDRSFFTPCEQPLYLTAMAVAPDLQRQGIGRRCMQEVARMGRELSAPAICLDAYDTPSGAGDFYRKCGYREVGRARFRNAPLIYFEQLL